MYIVFDLLILTSLRVKQMFYECHKKMTKGKQRDLYTNML